MARGRAVTRQKYADLGDVNVSLALHQSVVLVVGLCFSAQLVKSVMMLQIVTLLLIA